MARLESKAKAGFYPTPDSVCDLLAEKLKVEEGARSIDPCCGKGITLSRLAPGGINYGIELDHERAQEARGRLHKVLWADALMEVRITPSTFNLLYLNPPYDNALAAQQKEKRLEEQFLRRYLNALKDGGYLLLVIPYYVLKHCAKPLSRYFSDVEAYVFPDDEFEAFRQCVVIGKKRSLVSKETASEVQYYLTSLACLSAYDFQAAAPELLDMPILDIPAADGPLRTFATNRIDPSEAVPAIQRLNVLSGALQELAPKENNKIRPLNPLENGHLSLMMAGGYMNGAVERDGKQLVIKGTVTKSEKIIKSSDDGDGGGSVTTRDQYKPTVKVIDMSAAQLLTVQ